MTPPPLAKKFFKSFTPSSLILFIFELFALFVAKILTISFVLVSPSHEIALNVFIIFFFNNLLKRSLD